MKRRAAIFLVAFPLLLALQRSAMFAQETFCGGERIIKTVTGTVTEIGHPRAGITVTIRATDGITYEFGVESACVAGTTADRLKPGDELRVSFYNLTRNYPPTYGNPVRIALLRRGGSPRTTTGGFPPNTVVMDKFNGSTVGQPFGITYVPTPYGEGALFSRKADSRIEYRGQITSQGTLEWWVKVNSGFYYQNFQLHADQPKAMIFSTDAHGGDVTWPGTTKLFVYANGKVSLYIAISKYDRPPARAVIATATPFRFNQWHAIGISYGSEGEYIMVDGRLVASAPANTQALGAAGNHQEPLDVPTIGDTVSHFWQPHQYDGGFVGIVGRFRASATQRDWVLSAVDLPAKIAAGRGSNTGCSNATDLGFSLTADGQTYRVKAVKDAQGKQIPIFIDDRGDVVRSAALLQRLELGAWTRENVIAQSSTRAELAQKDRLLTNAIQTLQAMNNYQTVQDLLARGAATAFAAPQGLHERRIARVEKSAKPRSVAGGTSFKDPASYNTTFDDVVTFLKKQGYAIDSASKDAGTVFTSMSIRGHWHQTGTRVSISLIRDSKTVTEVQVAVTQQKRFKALQTEPWGRPKVNKAKSSALAAKMKATLTHS